MSLNNAFEALAAFQGESLTKSLATIESEIVGATAEDMDSRRASYQVNDELMASALSIKKVAGQINVIIHAAGIISSLESILAPGEIVESVSLGAGNTGKKFDLETNRRIAEYKFINWQGGSESIRQNGLFKDFFELAEYETDKEKYLYVVDTLHPLKFFRGGRALTSVLNKEPGILQRLNEKYGGDVVRVRDYFALNEDQVNIVDVGPLIGR